MSYDHHSVQSHPDVDTERQDTPLHPADRPRWEDEPTPEALYARINEISALYSRGKCTKALASQRLLDLVYDINQSDSDNYDKHAKSRYYLLIFNYLYRIRSARIRIKEISRRKLVALDQILYISEIDFSGLRLPGLRISNAYFKGCNFSAATLQDMAATSCHFEQCRFDRADLRNADISSSRFEGINFASSNCSSVRMLRCSLVGCDFSEAVSSRGDRPLRINGCQLVACSFREADLNRADFRRSRLSGCDVLDAKSKDSKGLF